MSIIQYPILLPLVDNYITAYLISVARELAYEVNSNFKSKKQIFKWLIRPEPSRTKGPGKLRIALLKTKNYSENGVMKEDRQYIAGPEERSVLLT